jgi:hypothetical protein
MRFLRQRAYPEEADTIWLCRLQALLSNTTAILIIGVAVFGLADVLDLLLEEGFPKKGLLGKRQLDQATHAARRSMSCWRSKFGRS